MHWRRVRPDPGWSQSREGLENRDQDDDSDLGTDYYYILRTCHGIIMNGSNYPSDISL